MTAAENDPVPPYVSFGTLLNQVERMERDGVPSKIDKYYLVGMAGGTQAHFKHALRSLGLIDQEDRSTRVLIELAQEPERRKELFAAVLRERFPRLAALDANVSKSDALEALRSYGINSDDTLRKSLTFFVGLAEYANLPVSPHIKSGRATRTTTGTRRQSRRTPSRNVQKGDGEQGGDTASSNKDMKRMYFDLLLKKAESSENGDTDLLDRIERLVGIADNSDQD